MHVSFPLKVMRVHRHLSRPQTASVTVDMWIDLGGLVKVDEPTYASTQVASKRGQEKAVVASTGQGDRQVARRSYSPLFPSMELQG